MKTYGSIDHKTDAPTVCALGCFDGVHIGHASIIKKAKQKAEQLSVMCAVWSFAEPPKNFFLGESEKITMITTADEKQREMKRLGVDVFVSVPFDKSIAEMSAESFFHSVLVRSMNAKCVVCGFNYRFGKGGKGDCELLSRLCEENGIELCVIPPVQIGDTIVSSTEIRNSLANGDTLTAALYLGRPYSLNACIVGGQQLGRTLGFPTLNQSFAKEKLVPKRGVYVSRISFDTSVKFGVTNVGVRPTVDGNMLCAETNLFDFSGDLYGKEVTVEFLDFLRPEQKFDSLELLTDQVNKDIEKAKEIIAKKYAI